MKLRHWLAVFALVSSSALADVTSVPVSSPQPAAPAYSWAGPYAGLQGGAISAVESLFFPTNTPLFARPAARGFVGGVVAGYNWQATEHVILGVEAEMNLASAFGRSMLRTRTRPGGGTYYETKVHATGALRARAGVIHGQSMFYVAGGVAVINSTLQRHIPFFREVTHSYRTTHTGWTVGLGVEHAIRDKWAVRADYRYSDFGTRRIDTQFFRIIDIDATLRIHDFRLGLVRKF